MKISDFKIGKSISPSVHNDEVTEGVYEITSIFLKEDKLREGEWDFKIGVKSTDPRRPKRMMTIEMLHEKEMWITI